MRRTRRWEENQETVVSKEQRRNLERRMLLETLTQ